MADFQTLIFAFVGIALSGVAALAAFVLLFFSCCCGVAEQVGKVKLGAFSWTVATGLCSIWILGEAIYRTVPQDSVGNLLSGRGDFGLTGRLPTAGWYVLVPTCAELAHFGL